MNGKVNIPILMYLVSGIWIAVQIVLVFCFWGEPQGSDQGEYMRIAQACFAAGEWYPMDEHVYSSYIWAPGFINFLILQLKMFGTLNANLLFNLLMNIGILLNIYFLGKKFFSQTTASVAVILWCLLYSNSMIVVPAGTELPFLFLTLTAFSCCLHPKVLLICLAGLLLALANWVRPFALIFLIAIVIYMLWKKYRWVCYPALFVPLFLAVFFIGKMTENKIGYFVYQSTTSGVNLIMTANDKAYGGVATSILRDSTSRAYIENKEELTFKEKDSIWKARSFEWIKEHPVKFAYLYIKKIGGLYIEDSWSDRPVLGGSGFVDSYVVGKKVSDNTFLIRAAKMGLKSLVYYFVLVLFVYSLFVNRKELFSIKAVLIALLLLGTFSTCLFAVSPRYHYPFLFVIVLFAGYGVEAYLGKKKTGLNEKPY